jgi:hypothetical protein
MPPLLLTEGREIQAGFLKRTQSDVEYPSEVVLDEKKLVFLKNMLCDFFLGIYRDN